MKQKLLVIKLGGAVVTYKDSPIPKARVDVIRHLSGEIKQVIAKGYQIILIHGAGSFAHGLTKKYDLHHGMKTNKQILAFGQVTRRMSRLNSIIIQQLLRAKLKAVGITPHTFITQTAGKLKDIDLNMIKTYLDNDQIPVLFGDLVLDDKWGCSVLSGDTIVCFLGKKLKADKVIFLSDVDGIYDSDPKKNPKAKLIPEITNKNFRQVLKGLTPSGRDDISGEMAGKILQIQRNLKNQMVFIVNGLDSNNLIKVLHQFQAGTKLYLR